VDSQKQKKVNFGAFYLNGIGKEIKKEVKN
jgi:hypothetical protein